MRIADLDVKHPDYDATGHTDWRMLYDGPESDRRGEFFARWLQKRPGESPERHKARTEDATYVGDVASLVDAIPAKLFSTPLELRDAPAAGWWHGFALDVDRQGTPASRWFEARLLDALTQRSVIALVSLPKMQVAPTSRLEQETTGALNAYLVSWTGEQIIRWGEDASGRLAWFVARDIVYRDEFGKPTEKLRRWTYVDVEKIERWTAPCDREPDQAADPDGEPVYHGFGELPAARLCLPAGLHALRQLRDPAVDLLRARVAANAAREDGAYGMWAIFSTRKADEIKGGEGWFLKLGADDKIQRMGTDAATHTVLQAAVDQARDALYRALKALHTAHTSDAANQASGEAKREDRHGQEVALSGYHGRTLDFAARVIRLVGVARGEPDVAAAITPAGLDSWQQLDLAEFTTAIPLAKELLDRSPTARKVVAKRQAAMLLPGAPELATIEAEIDAHDEDADAGLAAQRLRDLGRLTRPPAPPETP